MNKILIVYFSASGTTKKVAERIAEIIQGDLFEIEPQEPYTNVDLDWTNSNSRSSIEMMDKSSRPKIANKITNMNEYNTIYLGYPIWWNLAPSIVNTFLESYDMSNKKIITFATSGGSGIEESTSELESLAPNAKFINGKILRLQDVESFVKQTNI